MLRKDFFFGKDKKDFGEIFQGRVDQDVEQFLKSTYEEVLATLKDKRWMLDLLAKELVKKETMTGKEVKDLLGFN